MGDFADGLRASIDDATRNMTDAQAEGDDHGADVYHERLLCLRRVALHHRIQPHPAPNGQRGRPAKPSA